MPTTDKMTLRSFLQFLDLGGYLPAFENDGYDKMEDVVDMTFEDVMGIEGMKKGHAKRIIKHVNKIQK